MQNSDTKNLCNLDIVASWRESNGQRHRTEMTHSLWRFVWRWTMEYALVYVTSHFFLLPFSSSSSSWRWWKTMTQSTIIQFVVSVCVCVSSNISFLFVENKVSRLSNEVNSIERRIELHLLLLLTRKTLKEEIENEEEYSWILLFEEGEANGKSIKVILIYINSLLF